MKKNHLMRTVGVIATAAFAASVATSATSASASTAGTGYCSLVAPKSLAITTPYRAVTLRLGDDCAASGVDWANWDLYHPTQGFSGMAFFDSGETTNIWNVYDWDLSPGTRYTWRTDVAYDVDSNEVTQNQPYTDVKLGARASLVTSRSGKYVTLRTTTTRYSTTTGGFVRWGKPRGSIQYYTAKGWKTLRYAYQNASGYSSYKVYAPTTRSYRVVFPNSTTIWGPTTKTSRR